MTKARDLANSAAAFASVSATELGYVDGVTSAIQTQMDAKAPSSTAVTLTGTQTLTNKTLTNPVISSVINNTLTTTTGDIIYASAANTPARLGIGSSAQVLTVASGVPSWATPTSGSTFVGASVSMSAWQSVNDLTETILLWDTEQYDTNSIHNTSTQTDRMTVPTGKGGKWLVTGTVYGGQLSGGYLEIYLTVNGAAAAEPVTSDGGSFKRSPTCILSRILDLSAGDYIRLVAYQGNNGGAKNLGNTNSRFQFTYLGA